MSSPYTLVISTPMVHRGWYCVVGEPSCHAAGSRFIKQFSGFYLISSLYPVHNCHARVSGSSPLYSAVASPSDSVTQKRVLNYNSPVHLRRACRTQSSISHRFLPFICGVLRTFKLPPPLINSFLLHMSLDKSGFSPIILLPWG